MLTDLRSPNIDAPNECGSLHGGPTSSRMAIMLGGSFGPSRSGLVIAANRFKRSNALVYQPAPVASYGLPGYFLSGLYGCSWRDSGVGLWAWTWSSFCLSF